MELFLDTASADAVGKLSSVLTISGVTTNPTIIAKQNRPPQRVLADLSAVLEPSQKLFVQTMAYDVEDIVADARAICALRENAYAKIPATPEGLAATRRAKQEGLNVLVTAIYSADQAFLAAMNGADYLSPYVNRMCNLGDGMGQVRDLIHMLELHGLTAKLCAASFKNTAQVHELILAGTHALTATPDIVWTMVCHPSTQPAVDEFVAAWEGAFGRRTLN